MPPAIGARRRLEALRRLGWTIRDLARLTGLSTATVRHVGRRTTETVNWDTLIAIEAVYARYWDTPPRAVDVEHQKQIDRNAAAAIARGFPPALAWDNIDDPNERPKGMRPDTDGLTSVPEILALLRAGESPQSIAARLKVQPASLARRLRKHGHYAWAALCERAQ